MISRHLLVAAAAVLALAISGPAQAQFKPTKTIEFVVHGGPVHEPELPRCVGGDDLDAQLGAREGERHLGEVARWQPLALVRHERLLRGVARLPGLRLARRRREAADPASSRARKCRRPSRGPLRRDRPLRFAARRSRRPAAAGRCGWSSPRSSRRAGRSCRRGSPCARPWCARAFPSYH